MNRRFSYDAMVADTRARYADLKTFFAYRRGQRRQRSQAQLDADILLAVERWKFLQATGELVEVSPRHFRLRSSSSPAVVRRGR